MFVLDLLLFNIAMPRFKKLQKLVDRLNLVTVKAWWACASFAPFNTQAYEEEKFKRANSDLTKTNLFVNRLMVMMQPIMMLLLNITTIGIIWIDRIMWAMESLPGDMMAFMRLQHADHVCLPDGIDHLHRDSARQRIGQSHCGGTGIAETAINDPDRSRPRAGRAREGGIPPRFIPVSRRRGTGAARYRHLLSGRRRR